MSNASTKNFKEKLKFCIWKLYDLIYLVNIKKFSSFLKFVGRSLYSFAPEYAKVCRPSPSLSLGNFIKQFWFLVPRECLFTWKYSFIGLHTVPSRHFRTVTRFHVPLMKNRYYFLLAIIISIDNTRCSILKRR